MFNQANFRGGYNLKFISAMLFAVTFLVGGFFVANSAQAERTYTSADFTAFDGVGKTDLGLNQANGYTFSTGITATYVSGTGTLGSPVVLKLIGYAPIVTPWFGSRPTTFNYVTIGIKKPSGFIGSTVCQTGWIDTRWTGYDMASDCPGTGSTLLATTGDASSYLDFSFGANNTNYVQGGLFNLEVMWNNVTNAPEYFTIDVSGLQLETPTHKFVSTLDQLKTALADTNVTTIDITANISTPDKLVLNHPATINGNNNTISFTGITPTTWGGNYVLQVYNTIATLNNIKLTGGNAALYVNGSAVTLTGTIDVSGNGFGGIEVSHGTATGLPSSTLTVSGTLLNSTEAYTLPTIWTVTDQGTVTPTTGLTSSSTIVSGQTQYYLTAGNAVVPTSLSLGLAATYAVLGGTYTNTAAGTIINGDVGYTTPPAVAPTINNGTTHVADGSYNTAGTNQGSALSYLNAQTCDFNFGSPTNLSLLPQPLTHGVYCITAATSIGTGGIVLNGAGTYIFRIDGALTSAANSIVTLNGVSANDVFWTPTQATTLGANTTFKGTVIDKLGITVGDTTTWTGRALAFGGTVTTGTNVTITVPGDTTALDTAKTSAVTELNGYKTLADYSAENQTIIGTKILTGTTAINAATTIEDVATALATAKSDLDTVKTLTPSHGSSGSRPATPAIPANEQTPAGCAPGDKFSQTTGRNCNAATPSTPANGQVTGGPQVLGASTQAGSVLGAEKFNFTKFLKFKAGSYKVSLQGTEVTELQKLLTSLGYDLGLADGKFGPLTEGAVIKFQIANGLKGDGIVGPLTRAFLNK